MKFHKLFYWLSHFKPMTIGTSHQNITAKERELNEQARMDALWNRLAKVGKEIQDIALKEADQK